MLNLTLYNHQAIKQTNTNESYPKKKKNKKEQGTEMNFDAAVKSQQGKYLEMTFATFSSFSFWPLTQNF